MSKTRVICHIVFCTKYRRPSITQEHRKKLYSYILGILINKKCHLIRMNGMPDHIHLLIDLHPSISLADLLREVKQSSSAWLKENPDFPLFDGWGRGYFAVSIGAGDVEACRQYIINQQDHHKRNDFITEIRHLSHYGGVPFMIEDWE